MTAWVEVAKFLSGVLAWDIFVHASFLAANIEPRLLGVKWNHGINKAAIVFNFIVFVALVYFAWFRA